MSNTMLVLKGIQKELPVDNNTTLRDLLLLILNSKTNDEQVCASMNTKELTFKELARAAHQAAASLGSYNIVAICMRPSLEWIIVLCGAILRGIPYVPIEPTLPPERIKYILADCQASIVISDTELDLEQQLNPIKILIYSHSSDNTTYIDNQSVKVEQEDIFCITYTSGSTGMPKGVRLPHRALLNRLFWQWSQFPYDTDDVCCLKTSISFVDSITELFGPLLCRVPLIVLPKSLLLQIGQLISTMASKRITRIILVPSLLTVLFDHLENNKISLPDFRMIISSGETLVAGLVESFFKLKERFSSKCRLLNMYGSCEVMGDATYEVFESVDHFHNELLFENRVSIGYPIENTIVYIVDPDERGVGELVIAGNNVASGYHNVNANNVVLFNKFVHDNNGQQQFRTGDLGKIWNNRIILYGRNDTQVKIGGNRIDLSEIELIVKQYFHLNQSVAVYDKINHQIVLFLQMTGETLDLDRSQLAKYLPSYAVPSRIEAVADFPLLVSGKINRRQLVDSLNVDHEIKEVIEQKSLNVHEAFCLALEEIGILRAYMNRSFFAAGGSSRSALLLVAKLHRFGLSCLTVERLFDASTLNDILLNEVDIDRSNKELFFEYDNKYQVVPLAQIGKDQGIAIVVDSFATLGEIDTLIHQNQPNAQLEYRRQFTVILNHHWPQFVTLELSFGIINNNGNLLGVSLSTDAAHEPYIDPTTVPLVAPILTMLEVKEKEFLKRLHSQKDVPESIMSNFVTAVNLDVPPEKRTNAMYQIERHTLQVAKARGFQAIVTANTGSVTQQLAKYVFEYDENLVVQLNEYRDPSGDLVFSHADPNQTMTISMKYIV
ncbi:unnamed protein product [Rotaria socialis]|uniref:AMP-dependent synthetase/ligase domain-containing protein n=2 Tax=Rotaria socialis TaxID=392032 RepID=A0A817TYA1_9BILA|nr:unnamed protein product [Rotaria socialis]